MKASKILRMAWVVGLMLFTSLSLNAQNIYQLVGNQELKVMGGSTIHDWEMVASSATGKTEFTIINNQIQSIKMAEVTMKATALKSGKDQMDEITYKALKADKNPTLHFKLTSFKNLGGNKATVAGNLTIAGTTKPVTFDVQTQIKGTVIEVKGQTKCKMTDFNITPPTAMFGTIKTSDNIKITFKTNFSLLNS